MAAPDVEFDELPLSRKLARSFTPLNTLAWRIDPKDEVACKSRQLVEGANSKRDATTSILEDRAKYTFCNRAKPIGMYTGYQPGARLPFRRVPNPDLTHTIPGYRGHRPGAADGTLMLE
eukprot:c32339_g1_i1.p2 GENE.c32339_g1_i1~~c32339_g1_i1.p2  ORF type:complete len:119 (-),score=17.59 c32339_g1_i1:147-503(-)